MSNEVTVADAVVGAVTGRGGSENIYILGNGARARLRAVPTGLIEEAQARLQYPDPPMFYNKDMEREEPNPMDPGYLKAIEQVDRQRGLVAVDVMLIDGIELVDGVPAGDDWLKKLRFLERLGRFSLEGYDLTDEMMRLYVYLKYEAVTMVDLEEVMKRSRMSQEEYDLAKASFRSNEER